jgi:hypothetical protein
MTWIHISDLKTARYLKPVLSVQELALYLSTKSHIQYATCTLPYIAHSVYGIYLCAFTEVQHITETLRPPHPSRRNKFYVMWLIYMCDQCLHPPHKAIIIPTLHARQVSYTEFQSMMNYLI